MRKTLEVVDGFYPDPEAVRSRAAGADLRPYVDPQAVARIRDLLDTTADRLVVRPDAGRFVLRGQDVPADPAPRTDEADWVAVAFLPAVEPPGAGVSFWQAPPVGGGLGEGMRTMFVPVRRNRMVLYRPGALRLQATAGFGRGVADGWLSHELRFDVFPRQEGQARAE